MQAEKKMQTGGTTTVVKGKKGTTTREKTSGGTTVILRHENDKGKTTKMFGNNKTGLIYENYNTGSTSTVLKDKNTNTKKVGYQKSSLYNTPIYRKTTKLKKK